mgnify:CR=1 FL=1
MDSILDRFADNLTEVTYITNPAVARDEKINISAFNAGKISRSSR